MPMKWYACVFKFIAGDWAEGFMQPKLSSWSSYLHLPSIRVIILLYHSWLFYVFLLKKMIFICPCVCMHVYAHMCHICISVHRGNKRASYLLVAGSCKSLDEGTHHWTQDLCKSRKCYYLLSLLFLVYEKHTFQIFNILNIKHIKNITFMFSQLKKVTCVKPPKCSSLTPPGHLF